MPAELVTQWVGTIGIQTGHQGYPASISLLAYP